MKTVDGTRSPVLLVIGGRGPDELRKTFEATNLPASRVHCVVPTPEEASAASGCANVVLLDPWPGGREALADLVSRIQLKNEDVVQTLVAGSSPNTAALRKLTSHRDIGMLVPAHRQWTAARVVGRRAHKCMVVRPGAGMTIRGSVLIRLVADGWLNGESLTLQHICQVAGRVRFSKSKKQPTLLCPPPLPHASRLTLSILVPAHNEQACLGDTIRSLLSQSRSADEIVVINDGSTDETGEIARYLGARVIETGGTGSKGAAINQALDSVESDVVLIVDADTHLHPDAVLHLMQEMESGADATHGAVLPSNAKGIWARGRVLEYASAMRLQKRVQQTLGHVVVLSGCILAIRTDVLRAVGKFQHRTMVEDLDLTWTLHEMGYKVSYTPKSLAYPVEPANWAQFKGQMRRWSRGFFQSIGAHSRSYKKAPKLSFMVGASLWDVLTMPVALVLFLTAAMFGSAPGIVVKTFVIWQVVWLLFAICLAASVIGVRRALTNAPGYLALTAVSTYFYFEAFVSEWLLRRRLTTWVKGH